MPLNSKQLDFCRLLLSEIESVVAYSTKYNTSISHALKECRPHFMIDRLYESNGLAAICGIIATAYSESCQYPGIIFSTIDNFLSNLSSEDKFIKNGLIKLKDDKSTLKEILQYITKLLAEKKAAVIIFLDIDGVLLREADKFWDGGIPARLEKRYLVEVRPESEWDFSDAACDAEAVNIFDKNALTCLSELISEIEKTGANAYIVLSSAWRQSRTVEQLKSLFKQHSFSEKIIGKTYDKVCFIDEDIQFDALLRRAEEIETWLAINKSLMNIVNFIILDDIDVDHSELFRDHFVHCRSCVFNEKNLAEARNILENNDVVMNDSESRPINKLQLVAFQNMKSNERHFFTAAVRLTSDVRHEYILKAVTTQFKNSIEKAKNIDYKEKTLKDISKTVMSYM